MNLRVLCGFQDGADIAGARAAKALGLVTGGFMPPRFMTSNGPHPEYANLYGAVALAPEPYMNLFGEIDENGWKQAYRQRTILNVQSSQCVVWFGKPYSPGGHLTLNTAFESYVKYYVVVNSTYHDDGEATLKDWIRELMEDKENPSVCIAGNRESNNRGIEQWVYDYLIKTFKALLET